MIKRSSQGMQAKRQKYLQTVRFTAKDQTCCSILCTYICRERKRERSFSFATSSTKTPVFCGQQNYVFFGELNFMVPKKNSLSQSRPCRIQPRFAHVVRPLDRRSQKEQKKQAPVQLPSRRGFKFQASQSKSVVKLRKREADILTLKTCLS